MGRLGKTRVGVDAVLSHVRGDGSVRMVDVSGKPDTLREAEAEAVVRLPSAALLALKDNPKGNVLRGGVVRIRAWVRTTAGTGVEMEALTAVSVAALTVYDMCKAAGHGIVIERICLLRKTGGQSGTYLRSEATTRKETSSRKPAAKRKGGGA